MPDQEGPSQLQTVLLKGAAVLVGICVVVAIGTLLMVKVFGLDAGGGGRGAATAAMEPQPVSPLPTTALPVPGQSSTPGEQSSPSSHPSHSAKPGAGAHGFHLTAAPVSVKPMERINLTGTYAHQDNVSIQVQRFAGGQWSTFGDGVSASVSLGTFQTYVMTGRSGVNRFRMYDPASGKASNAVSVTVD